MAGFFPATFAWFLLSWPIFIFFTHDTGHPWPQMSKVKVIMLCRRFDAFAHWQRKVAETPIGRKAVRGSVPIKGDLHQFQGHSGKIKDQRSPGRLTPWPTITVLITVTKNDALSHYGRLRILYFAAWRQRDPAINFRIEWGDQIERFYLSVLRELLGFRRCDWNRLPPHCHCRIIIIIKSGSHMQPST